MKKNFEKIYSAAEKENIEKKIAVKIPKEEWQTLEIIAKRVGGDFNMEVKLGEPGKGSFFNPENGSIIFDPLHIKEKPEQAKFVAGHEGSHRAITLGPREIGLSKEQIKNNYSQIGFGYLQNVIEDPAVNDWMRKQFPGLNEYTEKVYNEQLKEENAVLSTSEVQKIATQLGYCPKFAQFGSEIIRDWHQQRFSKKLDPAVGKALKRTIKLARESITTIPDPQKPDRDRKEIIETARKRFENNTKYIWPEVKKLVEMDLHTEEQRQMLNDFRQKQKELKQKQNEIEQAQKQGDNQKAEKLQKEIDGLKQGLDDFNKMSEKARRELEEQMDKAIKEAVEEMNKEIENQQKQKQEAEQRQEELNKEIKDLEEKAKSANGKEKENLEKQIKQKRSEKLEQEMKQKQAEENLKNIQEDMEEMKSGESGMPFPINKLSEETKKEIEKLFKNLSHQKQKEMREKAEKQLEDFEDTINEEMKGKLNKDKPENHKEIREKQKQREKTFEQTKQTEKEKKELEKKLEKMRREKMTEYDKTYEEVADIINSLYNRLKKFFLPERHPKWRKGYPTGSRLDLEKAMQAEADPRYLEKIWQRKTIPHKFDYRFSVLVDLSSSMKGEKIEETFKGVVVLAEVLEKLGIQYEVIGFSSDVKSFKNWREKLNKEKRDELPQMKVWGGHSTHTDQATEIAVARLQENLGKNNFIITLTDGRPYPSEHANNLTEILKKITKENKVKLVGIGLGPGTEFVKDYYKAAISLTKMKISEQECRQGKKDFTETFADLLEDMIKHPEKY